MPSPPHGPRAPPPGACSVARLRKRSSIPLRRRRGASSYLGRAVPHLCLALPSVSASVAAVLCWQAALNRLAVSRSGRAQNDDRGQVGCRHLAPSMRTSKSTFPRRCRTSSLASRFLGPPPSSPCVGRGLTPRSRRGPTALHLAREAPWYMMRFAGQAQHRRSRLTSNVRPHKTSLRL